MTGLAGLLKAKGASLEAEDDFDAVNELVRGRGWSDGLPVVPPTAQRVERMLAYCDRPWDEPVAKMAPRYGEATPLRLGILDNSKGNADHLLRFIAEGVKAALPVASVVMTRKGSVSLPAPGNVLDQLTAEADFVVTAMAD